MSVGFGEQVEIIPVIDLMGGQVVQARGGTRADYQPIQSSLTSAVDLATVLVDLMAFFPFKTVYIADLDAIEGQPVNMALYQDCNRLLPQIDIWLDAGLSEHSSLESLEHSLEITPILGSESIQELTLLTHDDAVLSLDFKQGELLGAYDLFEYVAMWPDRLIVMNLDAVGASQGPDLRLLDKIRGNKPTAEIIAAGGVRDEADLASLKQAGVDKVLVATALHNGVLTPEVIAKYQ